MKHKWNDRTSMRQNLQETMPRLVREYFKAGRKAMKPKTTWDEMHDFRLLTKRFRYTLELFRPVYGPGLDRRLESLRKLQQFLGEINDSVTAQGLIRKMEGLEEMRESLARRAEKKTAELRDYWPETFDKAGEMERWIDYLVRFADRPRRASTVQRL